MAYMSAARKAELAPAIKAAMPPGWKYSLRVRHHSTLVLTIRSAPVDLIAEAAEVFSKSYSYSDNAKANTEAMVASKNVNVNVYHMDKMFDASLPVMKKIHAAMNGGNWDKSDIMTDYFNVGWYTDINIGEWDKPFKVSA